MADLSSLVIRLSADVANLQGDLGRANAIAQRSADQMRRSFEGAIGGMKSTVEQFAAGLVSAFSIGAFVALSKQAINTADEIGKMSQKIGVSTETLSALRVQAQLSDVAIESLQGGIAKLARNTAEAASGSKAQVAAFQAIGLSSKDAAYYVQHMDQLLELLSGKFAGYRDSAAKTALAQEFLGKSGADLIPLLNQLGSQGFAAVREEAEKYGQVITGDVAKASEEFNDNLTKLKLEAQGFAAAVTAQLLPALNNYTGAMVTAGQTNEGFGTTATVVADAIKSIVLGLTIVSETIKTGAAIMGAFYDAIVTSFKASAEFIMAWGSTVKETILGALTLDGARVQAAAAGFGAAIAQIGSEVAGKFQAIGSAVKTQATDSVAAAIGAYDALFGTFANVGSGAETTAKSVGMLNAPLVANAEATGAATKAQEDMNSSLNKAAQFLSKLQGQISPVDKAYQDYVSTIIQANKIGQDIITAYTKGGKAAEGFAIAQKVVAQATAGANKVLDDSIDKINDQADVLGRLQRKYADQASLIGMTDRQREMAEASREAAAEWQKLADAGNKMPNTLAEVTSGAEAAAAGFYDMSEAAKASQEAAREWQSIWENGAKSISDLFGQLFTGQIKGWKDFGSQLVQIAKQMVAQIISQYMQLKIIGPMQSMMGGGGGGGGWGSLVSAGVSAYTGGGGGGGGIGGLIGSYTGGSGGNGAIGQVGSAYQTGTSMWDGFKSGFNTMWNGSSGVSGYTGTMNMGGPSGVGTGTAGSYGGYGSALGQGLGIAGGVYAGYNRYQQSDGGVAGAAGAAAYGYGTYAAGMGMMAGMAAIPVVGWIAIALMLVDMFSGGKLFGTKGEMKGGSTALNIGAEGANYSTGISLKGQKALFGGAKWTWEDIPQTAEQAEAAKKYFDGMTKTMTEYAEHYGVDAGALLSASFEQKFDKDGKLTGETNSIIAGHEYTGLDEQGFSQAYVSANQLEVLSQFDDKLKGTIDQYLDSVEELNSIAAGLSQAQDMLANGGQFLAVTGEQTLSAVVTLAEGMAHGGELIGDAIQRLIQAQAQYDQFVSQFKPQTQFVNEFEAAMSGIKTSWLANIKQANELAIAAGAAGASEKDLANIHRYAAEQAAQALMALEQSAQGLAFSLGLTTIGSLDQVNSEIARLQGKANTGASSVQGFGNAMQSAAQQASDAINLLLGDLSPLNDQTKLQKALEGLRAGTVSQEQVLQIGRRLYASSQAYNDLFSMVTSMGRRGTASVGGGGPTGSSASGGGLTAAERQRLSDLLKEQQTLEAAAQLAQYQTLAKQIAEIASAKGEDWREVLEQMGINIADFEAGLQMTDEQTDSYIDAQQALLDDNDENTRTIVEALQQGFDDVVTAVGGTPRGHSTHDLPGGTDESAPIRRGHSGHMVPHQVGQEMARGFRDVTAASLPRSSRARTRA